MTISDTGAERAELPSGRYAYGQSDVPGRRRLAQLMSELAARGVVAAEEARTEWEPATWDEDGERCPRPVREAARDAEREPARAERCPGCQYMVTAVGHKIACGGEPS